MKQSKVITNSSYPERETYDGMHQIPYIGKPTNYPRIFSLYTVQSWCTPSPIPGSITLEYKVDKAQEQVPDF